MNYDSVTFDMVTLILDPMYNAEIWLLKPTDKPFIVHFSNVHKPWLTTLPEQKLNFYEKLFWEYAVLSNSYQRIKNIARQKQQKLKKD